MDTPNSPQYQIEQNKKYIATTLASGTHIRCAQSFELNDIQYQAACTYLYTFERIGALIFALVSFLFAGYEMANKINWSFPVQSIIEQKEVTTFVWIGMFFVLFLWYRTLVHRVRIQELSRIPSTANSIDIWKSMTKETQDVLNHAVRTAASWNATKIEPVHIMFALLSNLRIKTMCIRLSLPVASIEDALIRNLKSDVKSTTASPPLSVAAASVVLYTYELAQAESLPVIDVTELFLSVIIHDEVLQEMLFDLEVEYQHIENMLLWLRTQAELARRRSQQAAGAAHMSKHGMDRAMTAVATPLLNSFSHDITMDVAHGITEPCVARQKEIDAILQTIRGGRHNIVLIGERGVGKRAIVDGLAAKMVADDVPSILHDKRLVELSISSLVAGTTISGAQERLIRVIHEVQRSRNIVLFIDNIHTLISPGESGIDISETLAEVLSRGGCILFSTTTPEAYAQQVAHSSLGSILADIDVDIMDDNQAVQVLESKAPYIEYKTNVFFTYQSIAAAVQFAKKFMQQHIIPESAIGLLTEAGSAVQANKGSNSLVLAEDVARVVSQKTGVPVDAISDDESTKLLKLEEAMHERVVGQTEAVQLVASALRRARAAVRSTRRPIANFLFLGPTGVGKTELAKTIAEVYFGGEDKMIRLDMSEYQDASSIYRLIGQPGVQGTGILTEAVRNKPFSLILLDEMEKADPHILNIFLQVFDDGRLTDSVGRTVDFTNCIIIATSNAGTAYVQEQLKLGVSYQDIQSSLLHGTLQEYYRPEFLNRFDGIVLFTALKQGDIETIASYMLKRTAQDLETKGVSLEVSSEAIQALAEIGFDPEFGARPMRRAIQDTVENSIADLILQKQLRRRDVVRIEAGLSVRVIRPNS
jgi:ATP-dependent Clp protease ATP-binding subunit ClpA